MSLVNSVLEEIDCANAAAAEQQGATAAARAEASSAFVMSAARQLNVIVEKLLSPATSDLQSNGYVAECHSQEFPTHVVASFNFCPKRGEGPVDFHGAKCGMGLARNTASFLIRIERNSSVSITGTGRNHLETYVDERTELAELTCERVDTLLRTFLLRTLSAETRVLAR